MSYQWGIFFDMETFSFDWLRENSNRKIEMWCKRKEQSKRRKFVCTFHLYSMEKKFSIFKLVKKKASKAFECEYTVRSLFLLTFLAFLHIKYKLDLNSPRKKKKKQIKMMLVPKLFMYIFMMQWKRRWINLCNIPLRALFERSFPGHSPLLSCSFTSYQSFTLYNTPWHFLLFTSLSSLGGEKRK